MPFKPAAQFFVPIPPLFILELGVPSRGMLSKHPNKLFLSAQTLLGRSRVHSCNSHQKAVFHGPFVDPPPACFHFTSGAKTCAKMEFHFQMRFHKTFYQICRAITLAGFSPPCSGSFYPSPPTSLPEAVKFGASPSLQEQIKGLTPCPLIRAASSPAGCLKFDSNPQGRDSQLPKILEK